MNRRAYLLATTLLVGGFFAAHGALAQTAASRKIFNTPDHSPQAAFSNAILEGDTLYISGSIGLDPKTGKAPDEIEWAEPERQTRAVKEYLAALQAETEPNPDRKPPKLISPSDPCSAWTAKANKRVQFGYGLNYLIDIANAIIVDVEPTPARTYDEVESTKTMLDRTERRFGLKPKRLAADTAYGTGRFLGWLVGHRIAPHIPVRDASERDDGTLSRSDFRWDRRRGVYICPNSKVLHTTGKVHEGKTLRYLASKFDCDVCALKMQCCPKSPSRQIPRDVHEYARDVTRRLMRTKAFLKSRDQRKRVEMRFAHLKIQHGFERMRLRGLSGARDEFLLAATVQNLKTLALRILGPPSPRRRLSFA